MIKAAALFALATFVAPAQTQSARATSPAPKRPKLIVGIVVDQFRYDYLTRFRDQYTGGLNRLLTHGAVFTNAYFEHFPTVTAIGHSTFLSGATPSVSGIIGNEWYDRDAKRQVTSVFDSTVGMLGGVSRTKDGAASPRRMLVSTVGDQLKMAGLGSKVIGISVKDRSAILPAGHMADGAFWFDPTSGNFVSSTFYFSELPSWVRDFNQSRFVDKFISKQWQPVEGGAAFKTMADKPDAKYWASLESAPYGNDMIVALAEAAIRAEQLGKRNTTDLLAISFSANDYVGHAVGPDDPQVRDISIRTDRLLGDLFRFIDQQVGLKNTLIVFTADHGVSPLPETNQKRRMPGGRTSEKEISGYVQGALAKKYGEGSWISGRTGASFYLNHELIREKKLTLNEVAEFAAEAAREVPHIFRVYTKNQIARGQLPGDLIDRRIANGFFFKRAPDVTVVAEPYHVFETKGTSHGMPFQYDAHVPVIFAGEGIKPGRYHRKAAVNDIASTLATMLDVETPAGAMGRVLEEMLAPVAVRPQPVAAPSSSATGR